MVEYDMTLDNMFSSLADSTRRDILKRLSKREMTVSEIALPYKLTFAAISKHLKVLENASLIIKKRRGKERIVSLDPASIKSVDDYLEFYRSLWESKLDNLDKFLKESKE